MYMKIPIQLCGSKMPKRSKTIKNVMPGILIGNLMVGKVLIGNSQIKFLEML